MTLRATTGAMNSGGDPPGAVAVSTLEQPEPATSLAQGPRDLGLSLRARTPDSVGCQVLPAGCRYDP
jgi:hypothetical protein